MVYDNLITQNKAAFLAKLTEIAAKLKIQPSWLMIVFKIEATDQSGNISHQALNPVSGAAGYIQFMPATARGLGTTTAALLNMTNVQQLDYVYKYFQPYTGRINSIQDLYTITFFPRALGKPDNYVLQTDTLSASLIAGQNRPYDLNRDNAITAGELRASITKRIPSEALEYLKKK